MVYFGNKGVGAQVTYGVVSGPVNFKGKYVGSEFYTSRSFIEYNFDDGFSSSTDYFGFKTYDPRFQFAPFETKGIYDKTPSIVIDVGGPEIGVESNVMLLLVDAFRNFILEKITPIIPDEVFTTPPPKESSTFSHYLED